MDANVKHRGLLLLLTLWSLVHLTPQPAWCQEEPPEEDPSLIHWAYASLYGTGIYWVGDDQSVYVIRIRPGLTHRFPNESGREDLQWTLRIRFPLTVGLYNFSQGDLLGGIFPDRFRQVSLVPGLELKIPITRIWTLAPFAHFGWGKETRGGGDSAWIYWAGIKSRLAFHMKRSCLYFLNGLMWFGFTPKETPSQNMWAILTGLEFQFPLSKRYGTGDDYLIKFHVLNTWYLEDLMFLIHRNQPPLEVGTEWDIGLAFGKPKKMKLGFLRVDRIGLAYRWGHHITGIRVFFNTVF